MNEWSDARDRIQARVIKDSISPAGVRLTTLEVTMHRFVLAEFNTHRVFSRNSESSRAVPFHKRVEKVKKHPAIPVVFPVEQRGMSGGDEVQNPAVAEHLWLNTRDCMIEEAERIADIGVHKSLVNRLLEPFLWHTVVVTATEWDGFFHQRRHKDAQPEIRLAADAMWEALESSEPNFIDYGGWHLPFITERDREELWALHDESYEPVNDSGRTRQFDVTRLVIGDLKRISAARCARTSYLTHDGVRSLDKDLDLYKKLAIRAEGSDNPVHWSPLEHVATPCNDCQYNEGTHLHPGNFKGWFQMRHEQDRSPYAAR